MARPIFCNIQNYTLMFNSVHWYTELLIFSNYNCYISHFSFVFAILLNSYLNSYVCYKTIKKSLIDKRKVQTSKNSFFFFILSFCFFKSWILEIHFIFFCSTFSCLLLMSSFHRVSCLSFFPYLVWSGLSKISLNSLFVFSVNSLLFLLYLLFCLTLFLRSVRTSLFDLFILFLLLGLDLLFLLWLDFYSIVFSFLCYLS